MYFVSNPPEIGPSKRPSPDENGLRADTEFTRSPYSDSGTDGLVYLRAWETAQLAIGLQAPAIYNPIPTTGFTGGMWRMEEGPIKRRLKEQTKRESKMAMLLSDQRERKAQKIEQVTAPAKKKKKYMATSLGLKSKVSISQSERQVSKVEIRKLVIPKQMQVRMARLFLQTTLRVEAFCLASLGNSIFFIAQGRKRGGRETMAATRKGPLYPSDLKTKPPMNGLEARPRVMPIWKRLWRSSILSLQASERMAKPIRI